MKQLLIQSNKTQYFDRIPGRADNPIDDDLYPQDRYVLQDIIDFLEKKGFKDYNKIVIGSVTHRRSNDTYIWLEVNIPKTQKEIDIEESEIRKKEKQKQAEKEKRKQKRQEKIDAKTAALAKLSTDERKVLGY